jgi:hypothetical protein
MELKLKSSPYAALPEWESHAGNQVGVGASSIVVVSLVQNKAELSHVV